MKTITQPGLSILVGTALALWGLSCFLVHGSPIFAYVGMQAITSGVFALCFYRTEQKLLKSRHSITNQGASETAAPTVRVQRAGNNAAPSHPAEHQRASI